MTRSLPTRRSRWSRFARLQVERLEDRALLSSGPALAASYGQLPITFEQNQGQAASGVDYVAHANGYTLSLAGGAATFDLQGSSPGTDSLVQVQLVGASAAPRAIGLLPSPTKINYFSGSDPSQWHTNVPNFGRVEYQNVYSGINLDYYNNHGQVEYDLVVAPGADAHAIQMSIQGAGAAIDAAGNLVLHTSAGDIVEQAPVIYQNIGGVRHQVAGGFNLTNAATGTVATFQLGAYDHSRPLVIDPTLIYKSTILPQAGFAIAADSAGDAYVVGNSDFVGKLNPSGTAFIYQTHFGISHGIGIAIDSYGNAYVTGEPNGNFVTTANAFSTAPSKQFAAELDANGNLLYSTYVPGADIDNVTSLLGLPGAIAIDSSGNMYITGCAHAGLPTTATAFQPTFAPGSNNCDAFLAEFNPSLFGSASLLYCSYLGEGSDEGTGIAVDGSGNAYISGMAGPGFPTTAGAYQTACAGANDAFVAKFNPSLSGSASLVYSTFLGGTTQDGYYAGITPGADPYVPGCGIAVDSMGYAYIAGGTTSNNFPVTGRAFQTTFKGGHGPWQYKNEDGFVTKLNQAGSALVYSTYLGGAKGADACNRIAIDSLGNATVTGYTSSTDFPTMNPIQAANAGSWDAFVTTLNASGSALKFSSFLGTSNIDYGCGVALDSSGNVYETGYTRTTAFTGFVYKIGSPYSPTAVAGPVAGASRIAAVKVPVLALSTPEGLPPAVAPTNGQQSPILAAAYIPSPSFHSTTEPASPRIFAAQPPRSRHGLLDAVFANDWNGGE